MKSYSAEDFVPNGAAVVKLIERARRLTPEQIAALTVAGDAARGTAWDAALNAARGATWNAGRGSAWDAALNAAWEAAGNAVRVAVWDAAGDAAWVAVWAAGALVVRDLISEEVFDVLHGPWASVMER